MKKLFLLVMSAYGLCLFNAAAQSDTAVSKKATAAVKIDGKLDDADWTSATKYQIDSVSKGEAIAGGASDLSGYFQTLWTDSGIFVAVSVTDDVKATKLPGSTPLYQSWNADLVEVYFDMNVNRLKDGKGPMVGIGHYQEATNCPFAADTTWKTASGILGAYHYTGTNADYNKELFYPWTALTDSDGFILTSNKLPVGFDVTIVDNDKDAADASKGYRNRKVWHNNDTVKKENYQNMDKAGKLKFDGSPAFVPATVKAAKQKDTTIVIDGILTAKEWGKAAKVNIRKVMDGASIAGGTADCSAYFQTLWTDEGIYVAVTVTDDVKSTITAAKTWGENWNQDLVEIYFDMNVGKLNDGKGAKDGKGHVQEASNCPFGTDTLVNASGTLAAYHYTGKAANYVKEAFFPWKNLKDSASKFYAGLLPMGFDVTVVDNDKDTVDKAKGYRNRIVWSNNNAVSENYSNMNGAGKLITDSIPKIETAIKPATLSKTISLFPSPATDYVVVRTNIEGNFNGTIYNISGQVVLNGTFTNNERIDVARLNKGVYFINVTSNNQVYTTKFIKQ